MKRKAHSFNIIDIILILVILAAAALCVYFLLIKGETSEGTPVRLTITLLLPDRSAAEASAIAVGETVSNGLTDEVFGTIVDVSRENALKYTIPAAPSTTMKADRSSSRYDVTVTVEIDGYRDSNGLSYYTAFFSNTKRVAVGLKYSLYTADGTQIGSGFCTSLIREEAVSD